MMKIFSRRSILPILALAFVTVFQAQASWTEHNAKGRTSAPAQTTAESTEMFLGHCDVTGQIYESDGISLSYDSRVGAGIVIPKEMLASYEGAMITAMYVGWDDPNTTNTYECFVRENNFNAEDYTSGKGTVWFGWNRIELNPVPVRDVDRLCVGFYANIKKDVCSIPWLYPTNKPNSAYLYDGTNDNNGNELWYDMHRMEGFKCLAIMLVISDPDGRFNNLVQVTKFRGNTIVWRDTELWADMGVANIGSNAVTSITVNTAINGDEMGNVVYLENKIDNSMGTTLQVPIYCLGSGVHEVKIVEVNEQPLANPIVVEHEMIGVPQELEGSYKLKPLVEMFVSEESDRSATDFNKYFLPGFRPFADQLNLVFQHVDDKYMWGDNEGLEAMLTLCDNDSSVVYLPSFTVNRSFYTEYLADLPNSPFHYGTPFPEVAESLWRPLLAQPTFASVNVDARFINDNKNIEIEVSGNIAEGVMPTGEDLNLTVYVMEKNVVSQDQKLFNESDKSFYYGEYTHPNIVRDILTPYWGESLGKGEGDYSVSFTADVYGDYKLDNLFIVAFLNRSGDNEALHQQVINSTNFNVPAPESVNAISNDDDAVVYVANGVVYINGCDDVEVYTIAGARVANNNLTSGVYIARVGDVVAKVSVR